MAEAPTTYLEFKTVLPCGCDYSVRTTLPGELDLEKDWKGLSKILALQSDTLAYATNRRALKIKCDAPECATNKQD